MIHAIVDAATSGQKTLKTVICWIVSGAGPLSAISSARSSCVMHMPLRKSSMIISPQQQVLHKTHASLQEKSSCAIGGTYV